MELFAGLPDGELEDFAALCDVATAHPGQVVQAQDVPVRLWHVIIGGHAVVQRDGRPIGLLTRGSSWSEHSLLNQLRSPIAVVALSPLTLLTLRARQFFSIPERHPVLAGRLVARSATSADRLALPVFNALTALDQRSPKGA
jgi:signal-transduction protein with cAMP-binding, CBS, and nucleotidyltransferase domain